MSELPKDRVCDCAIQPCDLHRKLFYEEAKTSEPVETRPPAPRRTPFEVQCPHCKTWQSVYDLSDYPTEEGEHDVPCEICMKTFYFRTEVSYTWETIEK